jgi:cellobiose phosphorylase
MSSRSSSPPRNAPLAHLLSNGHYSVMINAHGSGYSQWHDMAVTRWREDATRDPWGSYLLVRDEEGGDIWSPTQQPCGDGSTQDTVAFAPGIATYERRNADIHGKLEVAVAGDADVELRRLTLTNHGSAARTLSVTAYAEVVIGPIGADNSHPAFSKMFVQTHWDEGQRLLLATRRRRQTSEAKVWAAQALQVQGERATDEFETDRARFIGRGRTVHNAQAMQPGASLSGTTGCVLDPVFALRQHVQLKAGESVTVLLWTQLADSRDGVQALAARLADAGAADALIGGAAEHARAEQQRLAIDEAKAARFARWMSALFSPDASLRAAPDSRARGRGGPPTLWGAGISGDRPIVLLKLDSEASLAQVHELLLAQTAWRSQRLAVDVVVLNAAKDADALQGKLDALIGAQQAQLKPDDSAPKAEAFCLKDSAIDDNLRHGLLTVARVVLGGTDPVAGDAEPASPAAASNGTTAIRATDPITATATPSTLEFSNGHGGFVDGGRAYRVDLDAQRPTPAPWVNVIANPGFGFIVSAEGGGYAWSLNSQQNPLTPWPNDPVSDSPRDILYLRDEESRDVWSATALPRRVADAHYSATHGKGWTRFVNDAHGIGTELTQCVPTLDSIKLSRLRLSNHSGRTRRISVTGYVEWALGSNGTTPAPFVVTARDDATGALFARNAWRSDFGERVAFIDLDGKQQSCTGDRGEFLGELGRVERPAALESSAPLSGRVGAGMDPCGALRTTIELPPDTQIDIVFALGDAATEADAQALVQRYRGVDIDAVLADVGAQWNGLLDTVQVKTPDRAMDVMLNHWLPYQVLASRVWARTAYYQASGAYGFRDQLQDVMALCVSRPDLAREHLLRAAGRQFAEGDVQHWWLPPGGQGIRTKIRDDRLWLSYVATHYVDVTGDEAVLDELLPFLKGDAIPDGASDAFFLPSPSDDKVSVYEHCARGIDSSLTQGAHGLPLMGTGDWNDGMNAVGEEGRGESSWLAWLAIAAIGLFAPRAELRGDTERAKRWRDYADQMRGALENAWDGEWYRRGYYDNGAPLGSRDSDECQIDTIAQSWSVIAGAPNRAHAEQAMASVDRLLVDHTNKIAKLFTPPFDHGKENPGYIKGYPPGVRENGGQYTHGATWSIFAWAGLGDGERATAQFDLLNPIRHSESMDAIARYKVEPYAACADVYSVEPHVGRGGWTWYTGSAAWLYRGGIEAVLGFHKHGERLQIDPSIPKTWPGFEVAYQHHGKSGAITHYEITVQNPDKVSHGVKQIDLDGQTLPADQSVVLADDGQAHTLHIVLG